MSDPNFDESKGIATRMSIMLFSMIGFMSIGVVVSFYGRTNYTPESPMYSYPIYITVFGGLVIVLGFLGFEMWNARKK